MGSSVPRTLIEAVPGRPSWLPGVCPGCWTRAPRIVLA